MIETFFLEFGVFLCVVYFKEEQKTSRFCRFDYEKIVEKLLFSFNSIEVFNQSNYTHTSKTGEKRDRRQEQQEERRVDSAKKQWDNPN